MQKPKSKLKTFKLYNGKEIIRFDEKRHRFWNKEGDPVIGVTTCSGVIDKPALKYWSANLGRDFLLDKMAAGKEITKELIIESAKQHSIRREKAANIGNQIHEWVSDWILGKKPKIPEDEKVVNGITAFLKFQKKHKVKWLESERVVYSKKHKYAGFLDAVGKIGKDLILIDFKSSSGIYDEMRFQVAGYQIAYEEETKKKFDRKMIIRFGKDDGKFDPKELKNNNKDKVAFLHCLGIKRRLKELKELSK